ncbi:MAG TPA: hypothetical protein VE398_24340 [Acidobacteriota bacterium]|nr:hypothetical protein [Acidobacteriota bacterium]
MPQATKIQKWRRTQIHQIEKAFAQLVTDLKESLVLDGIDAFDKRSGFRIRCHDLYGPLPDAIIEGTGEEYPVLDHVVREAAKLIAIARARREIADLFPAGAEFMLPTLVDNGALAGIRWESKIFLAEGGTHLEAYRELRLKVEKSS